MNQYDEKCDEKKTEHLTIHQKINTLTTTQIGLFRNLLSSKNVSRQLGEVGRLFLSRKY